MPANLDHFTARHAPCLCPNCGAKLDAATPAFGVRRKAPAKGDPGICVQCGAYLVFGDGDRVHICSAEEFVAYPAAIQDQLLRARLAQRKMLAERGPFPPPTKQ